MVLADEVFSSSGSPDDILWLLQDHQNSVTDVATIPASGQAQLVNHIEYNAFGAITSQTNSSYQPLQTYTGQIQDDAVDLLYYDARWYDPQLAKFTSEDPIGFLAGDVNLQRYVGNSMMNAVDPNGLDENELPVISFGRSNGGGPRVQYQAEIMFPQVARRLEIPGSDNSDTYSRWDRKGFEAGDWLVRPYYARDSQGREYIRYYSAITRLIDHPATPPRLREAWIIPPHRVLEFLKADLSTF